MIREYLTSNKLSTARKIDWRWLEDENLQVFICPSASEIEYGGDPNQTINSYAMATDWFPGNRFSVYYQNDASLPITIDSLTNTSGVLAISEIDCTGDPRPMLFQGSGNLIFNPQLQVQVDANGFYTNAGFTNTTLNLHNKEKLNFLLADGHVEAHHPYSTAVIGSGTPAVPQGMWTTAAGD
jgi:prepilin-type processing-associated H-X9-DG protein